MTKADGHRMPSASFSHLAGTLGIEPSLAVPKAAVLPVDDVPMKCLSLIIGDCPSLEQGIPPIHDMHTTRLREIGGSPRVPG